MPAVIAAVLLSLAAAPVAAARGVEASSGPAVEAAADAAVAGRHDQALAVLGEIAARDGRRAAFVGLVRELYDRDAVAPARAVGLGAARAWLADGPDDAAALAEEVIARDPDAPGAWALVGAALVRAQRHASALPHLALALDADPDDLDSRYYLASALWETGSFEDAEAQYRDGLARSLRRGAPAAAVAVWQHQLGRVLSWLGRSDQALEVLRAAADARPEAADLLFDLAQALDAAGEDAAAVETYRQVIALEAGLPRAHYGLARALTRLGREREASAAMATFSKLYAEERERTRREGVTRAHLDHSWDLLRQGRAEEAATRFAARGDQAEALRGLAAAHLALGRPEAARAALERAVVIAPDDPALRRELDALRLAPPPS